MREFVNEHRALIIKHARRHVQANAEKIPLEDVAREIELEIAQLAAQPSAPARVASPDAFLRALVRHATARAKRRRKLIEQIAAGDDLDAFTQDLKALDLDLPEPPRGADPQADKARATLDGIKKKLAPRDALVFALLIEDDGAVEEVARSLSMSLGDVEASIGRALLIAEEMGLEPAAPPSQPSVVEPLPVPRGAE